RKIDERQGEHDRLLSLEPSELAELGNQLSCEDHQDGDQGKDHPGVERREQPARAEEQPLEADFQPPHGHASQAPISAIASALASLTRPPGVGRARPPPWKGRPGASIMVELETVRDVARPASRW